MKRKTVTHCHRALDDYIDAAVAQFRAQGHEIRDEDIARLSPLKHHNLNLLGRYSFTASPRPPAPCVRCATRTRQSWMRMRMGPATTAENSRSDHSGPSPNMKRARSRPVQ